MDRLLSTPSTAAPSGGARGFVAARRRRRLQLQVAPELRWERAVVTPGNADPAAPPAWVLHLGNEGGDATGATVVLYTADLVARAEVGESGRLACGERWELTLEDEQTDHADPIRGYVLGRGTDGRWHATTVDGRTAAFRTQPDELGVLRTLGLRMPVATVSADARLRCVLATPLTELAP